MMLQLITLLSIIVMVSGLVRNPRLSQSQLSTSSRSRPTALKMSLNGLNDWAASILLSETTVSEEEILDVVGRASELPDPQLTITFAAFVLIGTAVLQFSLGDLTKEEGQARVRDFLATKRETERKRGYFD